jgi:hypothetical protein
MVEEPVVAQPMHARLLWWRLRWRCQEVGYLLDTFRKVQLRLFAQAFAVGVWSVEEIGVDIEEGVVVLVLGYG